MLHFFSKYKLFAIVLMGLSVVIVSIIYSVLTPIEVLPVYQPSQVSAALVSPEIQHQKKYQYIPLQYQKQIKPPTSLKEAQRIIQ